MNNSAWYANWFDTPFYHILYKNRDYKEAEMFMNNLIQHLNPPKNSVVLDLACGKGRHSIFMANLGFTIYGVDLSKQSIEHAKQYEKPNLNFDVHDMREVYKANTFDYVVNLFTSFGYFSDETDNQKAIDAMCQNLKPGGILVIDFMNTFKIAGNLKEKEAKTIDGIEFRITRKIENKIIVKTIEFTHEKQKYEFEERVMGLTLKDFESYFKKAGLKLIETFGNYNLDYYSKNTSDRLILVAGKDLTD
jgi:SAM-dependent methyltransferase